MKRSDPKAVTNSRPSINSFSRGNIMFLYYNNLQFLPVKNAGWLGYEVRFLKAYQGIILVQRFACWKRSNKNCLLRVNKKSYF
jgi:hypothetical protein